MENFITIVYLSLAITFILFVAAVVVDIVRDLKNDDDRDSEEKDK
jgi:TRAP-type C4-dicarboxylate transport system permease small subunit